MFYYDIHTHLFHPKIREKAIQQLYDHYRIQTCGDGSPEQLVLQLEKAQLDTAVVQGVATTAEQVLPANNWAIHIQQHYEQLEAFGTIHPDFAAWEDELDRLKKHNIRGLKLHADFQGFALDDEKLLPILEHIGDQFILMLHVGDDADPMTHPSSPYKVAHVAKNFPQLKMIAAHFGGYKQWQYVCDAYHGLNIFNDTSSTLAYIEQQQLEHIFKTIPREYILFGSDYPNYDPADERIQLQQRLNVSDAEMHELFTNANRLFL